MNDYYVRLVPLPRAVEGVTIPNDDGTFDIYINSSLSQTKQDAALQHELRHLKAEHFYREMPIERMERQAEGESISPVFSPDEGEVPCFRSEQAMANWLNSLCRDRPPGRSVWTIT